MFHSYFNEYAFVTNQFMYYSQVPVLSIGVNS
jgi:hypothetical protein